ncbi:MAG TPA: 2-dehydro-3-deoxygalactonokinase [Woeseiaceae bacterium]|nr:2-dehydro-3-deoxygalactonokinase [Woeseiaceae bacterium]
MQYVAGDWGTSRLRLWRVIDGRIAAAATGPGIAALGDLPAAARAAQLAALLPAAGNDRTRPRVLLAGMAGSRNGLVEAPYVRLPADRAAWQAAACRRRLGGLDLTIAAGVAAADGARPDVMRGEETQLFGALRLAPALRSRSRLAVLPGTHSKWVAIEDCVIRAFRTCMTGELYELLARRSTLVVSPTPTTASDAAEEEAGFEAGLARAGTAGFAGLFEARAAQLLDGRSPSWAAGWLSGFLVGSEIRELAPTFGEPASVHLVADGTLAARYARALAHAGIAAQTLDPATCTIAGLELLLEEAG